MSKPLTFSIFASFCAASALARCWVALAKKFLSPSIVFVIAYSQDISVNAAYTQPCNRYTRYSYLWWTKQDCKQLMSGQHLMQNWFCQQKTILHCQVKWSGIKWQKLILHLFQRVCEFFEEFVNLQGLLIQSSKWFSISSVQFPRHQFGWKVCSVQFGPKCPCLAQFIVKKQSFTPNFKNFLLEMYLIYTSKFI